MLSMSNNANDHMGYLERAAGHFLSRHDPFSQIILGILPRLGLALECSSSNFSEDSSCGYLSFSQKDSLTFRVSKERIAKVQGITRRTTVSNGTLPASIFLCIAHSARAHTTYSSMSTYNEFLFLQTLLFFTQNCYLFRI